MTRGRILAAILLSSAACVWVAISLAVPAPDVSAHANQLRAIPAPNDELEAAPDRVIIWFTEPIEPAYSEISVLDPVGAETATGETVFDPSEPTAMWRALGPLADGTYTVVWRNVSTIDGHRVVGSYVFAVGEPLGQGASVAPAEQPLVQSPADPFIRWTAYVAIAVLAGGLIFEMLIVSNILASPSSGAGAATLARSVSISAGRVMLGAGIVLLVAQVAQLLQQAVVLSGGLTAGGLTELPQIATGSAWGFNWSLRTGAALVALVLVAVAHGFRARREPDDDESAVVNILTTDSIFGALALASGIGYLVLVSLASHSAATPADIRWIAVAGDIVHITAATVWVGGLVYLLVASATLLRSEVGRNRMTFIASAAARFTPIAVISAAALFASGALSALMQVGVPDALGTPYGRVLMAKAVLTLPLVAVAGYNMLRVRRRLSTDGGATATLRRTVLAEVAVAALALLAAGWLASLEPARQYAERTGIGIEGTTSTTEQIDGANISLTISPGTVGANVVGAELTDSRGAPFTSVEQVRVRVRYLDDDFGEPYFPLVGTGDGMWSSEDDVQLSIAGAYQVEAVVVRTDAFDSNVAFRFSARSTNVATDQVRASYNQASLMLGVVIAVIGVALVATRAMSDDDRTFEPRRIVRRPGFLGYAGTVAVVVGIVVAVNPWTIGVGTPVDPLRNPWSPTQESVAVGNSLYATACASCHGESGRGDGIAGAALNPPPSDLAVHVPLHTDAEIYSFVAEGIDGTAMVGRSSELTADEIWHIINYVRTIDE